MKKFVKIMEIVIIAVMSMMTVAFATNISELETEASYMSVGDAVSICQAYDNRCEIDPAFLLGDMESNITVHEACRLLRSWKHIPLLDPVLYGQKQDAETFTAEAFQYSGTEKEASELITLGEFCNMAEKLLIPIKEMDVPETNDGLTFETQGSYDWATTTQWIQQAKTALINVPDILVDHFNEKGYVITLMTKDAYSDALHSISDITDSVACYSMDRGFLWSSDFSTATMVHEMGHHLMMWFGDYCEFEPIYKDEVNALCKSLNWDYARTNLDEGFAEAFSLYIEFPEILEQNCPRTFNFIKRTLEKIPN